MSRFPCEILKQIFTELGVQDLLQCQLTSKNWHSVSTSFLYSDVEILSNKESLLFARTISGSLTLGHYLKTIEFEDSSCWFMWDNVGYYKYALGYNMDGNNKIENIDTSDERDMLQNVVDKHTNVIDCNFNIIDVLINKCPNIFEINLENPIPGFFKIISYAYTRGHLSYLSKLPNPPEYNMEPYVNAALTFKKNLKSVYLYEEGFYQSYDYKVFQKLRNQIHEFTNLQHIDITILSNRNLEDLEMLIEDCPNLKEINVTTLHTFSDVTVENAKIAINPRSDIHKLECHNFKDFNIDQVKYIVQKFTNLQYLKILDFNVNTRSRQSVTPGVLEAFLCYVMNLPDCEVQLLLAESECIDALAGVANIIDIQKTIVIDNFIDHTDRERKVSIHIDKDFMRISLPIYTQRRVLSHISFLSKFGISIKSLELKGLWNKGSYASLDSTFYGTFRNLDWVLQILQFCPLLEILTLDRPEDLTLSNPMMLSHTNLKSLSITFLNPKDSTEFLEHLSLNLLNLKKLRISYCDLGERNPQTIKLSIPSARLDQLICEYNYSQRLTKNNLRLLIKLDTKEGEKFFSGYKGDLVSISDKQYLDLSPEVVHLHIICGDIKCLRVKVFYDGKRRVQYTINNICI